MDAVTLGVAKKAISQQVSPRLYSPHHLRRWRDAFADAMWSQAVITCLGDSLTVGAKANNSNNSAGSDQQLWCDRGYAAQLRSFFARELGDPGEGYVKFGSDETHRVTTVGSPAGNSVGPITTGITLTSGKSITVVLPQCTSFDICYWWSPGSTTAFTYTIDGDGGHTAPTQAPGSDTFYKETVTGLADTAHTIVITGPGSNSAFISGLIAKRGSTGVMVHRIGKSGATSTDLSGSAYATATRNNLLNSQFLQTATHLAVVPIGYNDWNHSDTNSITPTVYRANLQLITDYMVNTVKGCVLLVGEPRQTEIGSTKAYTQQDLYNQAIAHAAANDHVAFLDIGEVWGTYEQSNPADGSVTALQQDNIHPTRQGHGSMARILYRVLAQRGFMHA